MLIVNLAHVRLPVCHPEFQCGCAAPSRDEKARHCHSERYSAKNLVGAPKPDPSASTPQDGSCSATFSEQAYSPKDLASCSMPDSSRSTAQNDIFPGHWPLRHQSPTLPSL